MLHRTAKSHQTQIKSFTSPKKGCFAFRGICFSGGFPRAFAKIFLSIFSDWKINQIWTLWTRRTLFGPDPSQSIEADHSIPPYYLTKHWPTEINA